TATPRSEITSRNHSTRRASGSTSTTRALGRASANGIPGRPAPEPTSTTRAPSGTRSATTAQLRMCRSHTRSASRGPSSPRSIPDVTRCSAYRFASGSRSPKTRPSRSTSAGPVAVPVGSGTAEDDDLPARLLALALARHTLDLRDRVVHDLALERGHRAQPHRLTGLEHLLGRARAEGGQLGAAVLAPARDVEHQPAAVPRGLLHGEPGQ